MYRNFNDRERGTLKDASDEQAARWIGLRRRERARTRQGKRRDLKRFGPNAYGIPMGSTLRELQDEKPHKPDALEITTQRERPHRGKRRQASSAPTKSEGMGADPPGGGFLGY